MLSHHLKNIFLGISLLLVIPAQGDCQLEYSPLTITETAVAAVDNIPPAAVTEAKAEVTEEGYILLTWELSVDDKVVGFINYGAYPLPILGVTNYEIFRCGVSIGLVPHGTNQFLDTNIPEDRSTLRYRIDALDLDNRTVGFQGYGYAAISFPSPDQFLDQEGNRVYIVALNGATPLTSDFEDFIAFASAFNATEADSNYNPYADTDGSGIVGFEDFINFASTFNRQAEVTPGSGEVCEGF